MKKTLCLIISSAAVISSLFYGCSSKDLLSSNNKEKEKQIVLSNEKENTLDLNLYFNSSSSPNNLKMLKEERIIKKDELLGETIINELIKGPSVKSESKPLLPKDTRLISFSVNDNIAYINFSKEANISMSPQVEKACLESIILSLNQISSIHKVKLSIENKDVNIWGNHFDLSKPLGKNDLDNSKL
ncbi:GerMN domain-containing protein [Clostridium sp. JN-1]|uniref:GerMN domain-containing protein n=1 Tax=Clostridium sp. JN-1 TaxID=2483110 RepID=UPI000F0B3C96|nr:GerMN domain-containing protein [Clostridium sp. JN-1]